MARVFIRFSSVVAGVVALALLFVTGPLDADEVTLPVSLQVDLLVKVAGYDRNMAARAGDRVRIGILRKAGNDESAKVAAVAEKALADKDLIAGLPHEQSIASFADAAGVLVRNRRAVAHPRARWPVREPAPRRRLEPRHQRAYARRRGARRHREDPRPSAHPAALLVRPFGGLPLRGLLARRRWPRGSRER
jgi:hypothetical protein